MVHNDIKNAFRDIWVIFNSFDVSGDQAAWDNLVSKTEMIYRKYGQRQVVMDFICSILDELQRMGEQK